MAIPWEEIEARVLTPKQRARVKRDVEKIIQGDATLMELRRQRQLTQVALAAAVGGQQGDISKLEQRGDAYISTVRRYVEALGGTLDLVARFPDGDVRITQFHELEAAPDVELEPEPIVRARALPAKPKPKSKPTTTQKRRASAGAHGG